MTVCMKESGNVCKLMLTVSNPCLLQVWLDEDVELYDFAKVRPLIKKKQIMVKKIKAAVLLLSELTDTSR